MSYIKLTDLVQKVYREHPDKLISTSKVQLPDINKIFERLDQEVQGENKVVYLCKVKTKGRPKNTKVLKKAALLTASILILSTVISAIMDTPQAKALKFSIMNAMIRIKEQIIEIANSSNDSGISDHINNSDEEIITVFTDPDEAEARINAVILLPAELPPGYQLDRIEWMRYSNKDQQRVIQIYKREQDSLEIIQVVDPIQDQDKTFIQNIDESAAKEMTIVGRNILIINVSSGIRRAIWYEDSSRCEIRGSITEDEILHIVESIIESIGGSPD